MNVLKFKHLYKNISLFFITILVISSTYKVSGVTYHYEEDFSSTTSTQYELLGGRFNFDTGITPMKNSWVIDNGELVSDGVFNGPDHNFLVIEDNTSLGVWSLDVFLPDGVKQAPGPKRVFTIMWSEKQYYNGTSSTSWFGDFNIEMSDDDLALEYANGTESIFQIKQAPFNQHETFNHYDVVRTNDRVYVFIDGYPYLNESFPESVGSEINLCKY